jgi:hypothetical protein
MPLHFVGVIIFGASVDVDDSFTGASFSCFSGAYVAPNDSLNLHLGGTFVEVIVKVERFTYYGFPFET